MTGQTQVRILTHIRYLMSSLKCPDQIWSPYSLSFNWHQSSFLGGEEGMKLYLSSSGTTVHCGPELPINSTFIPSGLLATACQFLILISNIDCLRIHLLVTGYCPKTYVSV